MTTRRQFLWGSSAMLLGSLSTRVTSAQDKTGEGMTKQLIDEVGQPCCGKAPAGASLSSVTPITTDVVVDIALDRQSFLDRGWTEDQLGSYPEKEQGVALSMFYAIEMGRDKSHMWNKEIDDFDRGIGAHIDYYFKEKKNRTFELHAYSTLEAGAKRGTVVGRRPNEAPFNKGSCSGRNVVGCAGGNDKIYVNTDHSYVLGRRLDEPGIIKIDGRWYVNLTTLISHEVGHFFGFPHVDDPKAVMYYQLQYERQRWHDEGLSQQKLFFALADKLGR